MTKKKINDAKINKVNGRAGVFYHEGLWHVFDNFFHEDGAAFETKQAAINWVQMFYEDSYYDVYNNINEFKNAKNNYIQHMQELYTSTEL